MKSPLNRPRKNSSPGKFLPFLLAASLVLPELTGCGDVATPQANIATRLPPTSTAEISPAMPPPAPQSGTSTMEASPQAGILPTTARSETCSPLKPVNLGDLPQIVTNPFSPPLPGRDDGHHGTDFAFYRWGGLVGILGVPVQSVLSGRIAASLPDRPPYGNVVIVETDWDRLPPAVQNLHGDPPPTPVPGDVRLTCPGYTAFASSPAEHPSLYLLYAHLKTPSRLHVGDEISCGEPIGEVGTTGTSTNPHLHLETRFGPSGATFSAMAHYANDAAPAEMTAYCTWRVSGEFVMVDPIKVLFANSSQ